MLLFWCDVPPKGKSIWLRNAPLFSLCSVLTGAVIISSRGGKGCSKDAKSEMSNQQVPNAVVFSLW